MNDAKYGVPPLGRAGRPRFLNEPKPTVRCLPLANRRVFAEALSSAGDPLSDRGLAGAFAPSEGCRVGLVEQVRQCRTSRRIIEVSPGAVQDIGQFRVLNRGLRAYRCARGCPVDNIECISLGRASRGCGAARARPDQVNRDGECERARVSEAAGSLFSAHNENRLLSDILGIISGHPPAEVSDDGRPEMCELDVACEVQGAVIRIGCRLRNLCLGYLFRARRDPALLCVHPASARLTGRRCRAGCRTRPHGKDAVRGLMCDRRFASSEASA
jgi:hypothetical protein